MILVINMLLKKLIKNLPDEKKNIKVRGIADDSRKIKKGFIFFAIKGNKFNGEKYIDDSIKKGANVIVCSKNCKYENNKILILKISNPRFFLSKFCSKFYKLKPKNIIGITGTNGKTSVADLFYQILSIHKIPVASIGTLGIKFKGKIIKSDLTSPNTILLHQTLEKLKKNKIDNVIIEASSHGLHQYRLNHLKFNAGIFTNFSQDHLDYHKTMQSYLNAKLIFFKNVLSEGKTIISDKFIKEYPILKRISQTKKLRFVDIGKIKEKLIKKNLKINEFQIKNLSMAIEAAKICKISEKKILNSLTKIKSVDGRLELVKTFSNSVRVFVDFAHTPDALKKSLLSLKAQYKEDVSLVFGCGGDRDTKKRPFMAKIASSNCKNIYVTDDNPRNERPEKIRAEIIRQIKNKNIFNIGNRSKAIRAAILNAEPNEIILIAGKGHEQKQVYKNKVILISDKKIVKNLKVKIKKISEKKRNYLQNKEILKSIQKKNNLKDFHGIAIDSRVVKKNNLFLTIKGKNNNGVKFIPNALKKGAQYIISSNYLKKYKNKTIKVKNEIKFLNRFASEKRKISKARVFAVTGSAGKTSLKNLLKKLLQNFGDTFCSPKSYNNHFGVPLSLSHLNTKHKFAVFEVGMSRAGEINNLTKLIKPEIGIITNIGEAHIENFNNLKGIALAKGEIINNLKKGGTIILNRDDKFFKLLLRKAKLKKLKVVSFGYNKKSDIFPLIVRKNNKNTNVLVKISNKKINLTIKNLNIYNVLSTLALLKVLNVNLIHASKYFKNIEPTEGRGKIYKIKRYNKNFKLIDESYNANPLSVKNAIENFNLIKKNNFKKYLILGDMLELGKKSEILHKDLSKVINNSDIDKVFVKGVKTLVTYKNINKGKRGNIFQQEEDIDFNLKNIISNNDYLMIKGSNATGLNNFSKRIIKGY